MPSSTYLQATSAGANCTLKHAVVCSKALRPVRIIADAMHLHCTMTYVRLHWPRPKCTSHMLAQGSKGGKSHMHDIPSRSCHLLFQDPSIPGGPHPQDWALQQRRWARLCISKLLQLNIGSIPIQGCSATLYVVPSGCLIRLHPERTRHAACLRLHLITLWNCFLERAAY